MIMEIFVGSGSSRLTQKRVSAPVDGNMRCFATPLQMIFNGTPRGIELFRLLPDTDRTGAFAPPPMIQDPRNVMNSAG